MMKLSFKSIVNLGVLSAGMFILSCAAEVVKDPAMVREKLVEFNLAVQSSQYDKALELLVIEERQAIMGPDGEPLEKFAQGMKRLNLSTLLREKMYLVDGKIKGMLNVLEEANRAKIISDEQRSIGITSSSLAPSSSSSVAPIISSSSISDSIVTSSSIVESSSSVVASSSSVPPKVVSSSSKETLSSSSESAPVVSSSIIEVSSSSAEVSIEEPKVEPLNEEIKEVVDTAVTEAIIEPSKEVKEAQDSILTDEKAESIE